MCYYTDVYGSIPINTIFSGMNIHLPAILMFTRYQGFDPSPDCYQPITCFQIPYCIRQLLWYWSYCSYVKNMISASRHGTVWNLKMIENKQWNYRYHSGIAVLSILMINTYIYIYICIYTYILAGGLEQDFYFSHRIGNIIIPTVTHSIIFQRGRSTTNQYLLHIYIYIYTLWLFNIAMV